MPDIDDKEFDDLVIRPKRKILVFFYNNWTASCDIMLSILERLGDEFRQKIKFYKVDAEKCQSLTERYQINSVPIIITFDRGEINSVFKGIVNEDTIRSGLADI